jgi:hypothetical protein
MEERLLPFDDPSVLALDDRRRRAIAAHWTHRATSERRVGLAFDKMVPRLQRWHAPPQVIDLLKQSASDEARHSLICTRLAETYAGEPCTPKDVGDVPLPNFGTGDDELETALLVAGMCCVNETIATAWIAACHAVSQAPLASAANRLHLQDEIDHARLGWAYFASETTSRRIRDAVAECLPRLLQANVPQWELDDPELSEGIAEHGHLDTMTSRQVIHESVRDLVIAGFAHVGVDTRPARAWLRDRRS